MPEFRGEPALADPRFTGDHEDASAALRLGALKLAAERGKDLLAIDERRDGDRRRRLHHPERAEGRERFRLALGPPSRPRPIPDGTGGERSRRLVDQHLPGLRTVGDT